MKLSLEVIRSALKDTDMSIVKYSNNTIKVEFENDEYGLGSMFIHLCSKADFATVGDTGMYSSPDNAAEILEKIIEAERKGFMNIHLYGEIASKTNLALVQCFISDDEVIRARFEKFKSKRA